MRRSITILLLLVLALMEVKAQVLPFCLSKGAGTFRLGIVAGDESRWLDECSLKKTLSLYIMAKVWGCGLLRERKQKLLYFPVSTPGLRKRIVTSVSINRMPRRIIITLCYRNYF